MSECEAIQYSDQVVCEPCRIAWDVNDPTPPDCWSERGRAHSVPTLRDQFAMAALPAVYAEMSEIDDEAVAISAYAIADAMLKEREK